ncbi:MAG: hypothetical protein BMS9Abin32_206 [Gammaproteobacteria bacterium]|nr:MAG: hypothetical protein BMS9Abin32_206 [Gammaproteobacteria bacterium]
MQQSTKSQSGFVAGFGAAAAMQDAKAKQAQFYPDLNYPNKKQFVVFPAYTCLVNFAQRQGCKRILEIGAGLSTAVWADYAGRTGAAVCSVDADHSRMRSYVRNTPHDAAVTRHVNLIEGVTIDAEEFLAFYAAGSQASYAGVAASALAEHLNLFQSASTSPRRRFLIGKAAGRWRWTARDLLSTATTLSLPRPLLDVFSSGRNFDHEIAFLREADAQGAGSVIDRRLQQDDPWDLIFFDSGELASMLEWTKLKDRIAVGGFAAFHDIFFPKSIKNIVPCAGLVADPDWEVVFCDNSTRQGLLIAKRLR